MKLVSFNVNSVRLRLHQLEAIIEKYNPEVIGLQETKVNDPDFPIQAINALGYGAVFHGQKTHYGVAILSRIDFGNVQRGFQDDDELAQRRVISADFTSTDGHPFTVINAYFPQGENKSHLTKFPAKNKFYSDMRAMLNKLDPNSNLALIGDFNVAPVDKDIGIGPDNARRWLRAGNTSFLPIERQWFTTLTDWGLVDTYRKKYPGFEDHGQDDLFSWFDYRSKGFDRSPKRGLRIDHILTTRSLADKLVDSGIDYDVRAMPKPSDHCPVWSSFNI